MYIVLHTWSDIGSSVSTCTLVQIYSMCVCECSIVCIYVHLCTLYYIHGLILVAVLVHVHLYRFMHVCM